MSEGVEPGPGTLTLHHHFGTVLYCSWGEKYKLLVHKRIEEKPGTLVLVLTGISIMMLLSVLSLKEGGDELESLPGITEITQGSCCHLSILETMSLWVWCYSCTAQPPGVTTVSR